MQKLTNNFNWTKSNLVNAVKHNPKEVYFFGKIDKDSYRTIFKNGAVAHFDETIAKKVSAYVSLEV